MRRNLHTRCAAMVLAAGLGAGLLGCSSGGGSTSGPIGPAPTGTVPGAGDLKIFDTASSQSVPFRKESLERRQEMARQICDAIKDRSHGDALAWVQQASTDPSVVPFASPGYPDLLLFTSAALRYQCPGYLEQIQHSGGSLPLGAP